MNSNSQETPVPMHERRVGGLMIWSYQVFNREWAAPTLLCLAPRWGACLKRRAELSKASGARTE